MSSSLHLLHCSPDLQRLTVWATRRRLLTRDGDFGYALHALLHATFGDAAPQPFHLEYFAGENVSLIAYSSLSAEQLLAHAALTEPDTANALGLDPTPTSAGLCSRVMPIHWREGSCFAFKVRARPVVRTKLGERDAFLNAVEKWHGQTSRHEAVAGKDGEQLVISSADQEDKLSFSREEVYGQWLADHFIRARAARLLDVKLEGFKLGQVLRQTASATPYGRERRAFVGPDVVLSGHLQIIDPIGFSNWLARGIGRHLAFGFGMLRLSQARIPTA